MVIQKSTADIDYTRLEYLGMDFADLRSLDSDPRELILRFRIMPPDKGVKASLSNILFDSHGTHELDIQLADFSRHFRRTGDAYASEKVWGYNDMFTGEARLANLREQYGAMHKIAQKIRPFLTLLENN